MQTVCLYLPVSCQPVDMFCGCRCNVAAFPFELVQRPALERALRCSAGPSHTHIQIWRPSTAVGAGEAGATVEVAKSLLGYVKASCAIPVVVGDEIFSELGCKPLGAIVTNHEL